MWHPGNPTRGQSAPRINASQLRRAWPWAAAPSASGAVRLAVLLGLLCLATAGTFGLAARAAPADTSAAPAAPALKPGQLPPGQEGRIPFANARDGILDWRADGERGIWVESPSRQWYYGKFMSSCLGLDFANRVGFDTEANGDFDKFSYVLVRDGFPERCQLTSLVTSNGPPTAKQRKAAAAAAKANAIANADPRASASAPGAVSAASVGAGDAAVSNR